MSRFFHFIKKRLSPDEKFGLYLTVGSIITFLFILLFFKILREYTNQEILVKIDQNILNVMVSHRTNNLNQIMPFFTHIGDTKTILLGVIITSIILYILKHHHFLISLLISVIGGEIFVWLIKNIIERPRPPIIDSLVNETSFSFPSGHAFVAISFYGLITFIIFQSIKKKWLKIITLILGILLILTIGFSRIYLGAHWTSDVLASYASGIAWLSTLITALHIKGKFNRPLK